MPRSHVLLALLVIGCGRVTTFVEQPLFGDSGSCQMCSDGVAMRQYRCSFAGSVPAGEQLTVYWENIENFRCLEVEVNGTRGWIADDPRTGRYEPW